MKPIDSQQLKEFISAFQCKEDRLYHGSGPIISIVVPSYNQAAYLERSILSILNQGYPNLELIIIDGASTDGSFDIIKKYEKHLHYWVSEKDQGQSDALNKGFHKATGELIGWQNSDDIYLPGAFFTIAKAWHKYPDADVLYGNRLDIDADDNIKAESRFTDFSSIVCRYDGLCLMTQSTFFKRKLLQQIGMLDITLNYAMDYEFFIRAARKKARFQYIPHFLGAMRRHSEAKTEMYLGTPVHNRECAERDARHHRVKLLNLPMKIYSLMYRVYHYCRQGDHRYVWNGIFRRLQEGKFLKG